MSPERIQPERIKLLEEGIKLKKKLAKKGSNLSTKDMEEALQFSKKAQALNMAAAENVSCASCHGKVTPEQYAYRMQAHPKERMLCTGCASQSSCFWFMRSYGKKIGTLRKKAGRIRRKRSGITPTTPVRRSESSKNRPFTVTLKYFEDDSTRFEEKLLYSKNQAEADRKARKYLSGMGGRYRNQYRRGSIQALTMSQ